MDPAVTDHPFSLSSDFFSVFNLAASFDLPQELLLERYRELQKQLHPDRFAAQPDAERRWSVQAAGLVNEAYQTLSKDIRRAAYLLEINGINVNDETDTRMDPMFLMGQMEMRESLETAEQADDPEARIESIRQSLKIAVREQAVAFSNASDAADWEQARTVVRQWQFLDKMLHEVKQLEERLDA